MKCGIKCLDTARGPCSFFNLSSDKIEDEIVLSPLTVLLDRLIYLKQKSLSSYSAHIRQLRNIKLSQNVSLSAVKIKVLKR